MHSSLRTEPTHQRPSLQGVYLITPDELDTELLLAKTQIALSVGIGILQYRNKRADTELCLNQAIALRTLCQKFDTPFVINDDVALALAVGADGVHLGEDDGEIRFARQRLGNNAIVGATCYDRLDRAQHVIDQGATYVAFGAFFPSSTKPLARPAKPEVLTQAQSLLVPKVAIGGITPDNGQLLTAAGADLLAVISGVYAAPDIGAAVRAYQACFRNLP